MRIIIENNTQVLVVRWESDDLDNYECADLLLCWLEGVATLTNVIRAARLRGSPRRT